MKLANKNSSQRDSFSKGSSNVAISQVQYLNRRRDSAPISSIATINKMKRQRFNQALEPKYISKKQEQNQAERLSTNEIYDSRRHQQEKISKLDWKILTLKEIKNLKNQIVQEHKVQQQQNRNRKIFVSIAKNKRDTAERQKNITASPKLAEIGGKQTLLRSISNKRNIVNNIQFQIDQSLIGDKVFCV